MPEICRFFGIIIRMFAEPGAPHHCPHFHAYYQNSVAIFSIDTVELISGSLPQRKDGWSKPGLNFIKVNCWKTGTGCSLVSCLIRLHRSDRQEEKFT